VKVKDIYQNPKGYEHELLSLCCVDKTLSGWNLERVASICRERCGGQGYISANRFGDYLSLAHTALTAEGDNKVLMVKVCKDMISNITKKGHKLPQMEKCPFRDIAKMSSVMSPGVLLDLLKFRESSLFEQLMGDIKSKTPQVGKYNVLMRETSDVMQALALAYGER
jgi:acyl-CoA oxidase